MAENGGTEMQIDEKMSSTKSVKEKNSVESRCFSKLTENGGAEMQIDGKRSNTSSAENPHKINIFVQLDGQLRKVTSRSDGK